MEAPALKPDDFCICFDDPWTAIRSLVVEKIEGERVTVRRDGLPIYPVETEVIAADRLVYSPYRNATRRAFIDATATVEQQRQLDQAVLVRVVTANITAERQAIELADLKQRIAEFLPELSADFIDVCLRAMTASSSLTVEPAKKGKAPHNKIKLIASEDMLRSED